MKGHYGVRYDATLGAKSRIWTELAGLSVANQNKTGPGERKTSGYTRGDIRMGVDIDKTWSFIAAVENFTDKHYRDHLSSTWQAFGLNDQVGRNVKVMVKARFWPVFTTAGSAAFRTNQSGTHPLPD
uniref:TonB dependent receptor n=1 Tax=Candidatus Kentrum sp. FW TaxID=2126338 RepID=A0A450TXQ2_9GAMM|nr:MAG: TonB dependent receptor [Candidatus Kentron sp. FW]